MRSSACWSCARAADRSARPSMESSPSRAVPPRGVPPAPSQVVLAGEVGRLGHDHDLVDKHGGNHRRSPPPARPCGCATRRRPASTRGVRDAAARRSRPRTRAARPRSTVSDGQALGCDDLQLDGHGGRLSRPAWRRSRARRRRCRQRKRACSGRVSILPSRRPSNDATVSLDGTRSGPAGP